MFQVRGVTKRYGKVVANDSIRFDVKDGEIAVLLGPNGAGKSTIIKCIAGLLRFEGEIDLCGYPHEEEEILDPMDTIREYQERRTTLNAEIDKVLVELEALLPGGVSE